MISTPAWPRRRVRGAAADGPHLRLRDRVAPSWPTRGEGRIGLVAWVLLAVAALIDLSITGFTLEPNRTVVLVFCVIFFSLLVARLIVASRGRPRGRWALWALAAGILLWAGESALLLDGSQTGGHGEHLASGEVAFIATYLTLAVYLLLDADARPSTAIKTWLETAVICGGSASLAGALVLTQVATDKPQAVSLMVALFYPVADSVLGLLVVLQLGLRMRGANRKSARILVGFLLLAVADASFVNNVLHGSAGSNLVTIVLWAVGFGQLVSASCRRSAEAVVKPSSDLPMPIIVAAMAAAVTALAIRPEGRFGIYVALFALATVAGASARIYLALRDARVATEAIAQAQTDDLTMLPNRRGVLLRLEQALSRGEPLGLMIMDLNGFKDINDALGHAVGDVILQMCGRRTRAALPDEVLVGRLGGDEFAVVVPDANPLRLVELANVVLNAIREPAVAHGIELIINASIGITVGEPTDTTSTALLRRADVAMYQAKTGGGGAALYERSRDEFSRERLRIVDELRNAIVQGQLVLWYQPQIDASTQRVRGFEALIRWAHPKQGMLSPISFLPAARHAGLMPALSECVIKQAVRDVARWRQAGLYLPVSLNCAPPELLSGVFVRQLVAALGRTGLRASDFVIELTEDSFLSDPERARDLVAQLRDQGLEVSIDDYGTGFSSLAYLRDLPIDEIKIDRSFVRTIVQDRRSEMIVESTIKMAHALDLRVVAEGVEDAPIAAKLVAIGADVLQGFHVARPMPAEDVLGWSRNWAASLVAAELGRFDG